MDIRIVDVWKTLPKMARVYLLYTLGLVILYLVLPAISYLIFWKTLPKFSLSMLCGLLLMPALILRPLLILTRQLPIRGRYLALGYLLLLWISVIQIIWFPTISAQVGIDVYLSTISFTFIGTWLAWLGGESLGYIIASRPRLARIALFVAYLGLASVVVAGVSRGFTLYSRLLFAFQDPVSRDLYNYLALADSLAIVGILLLGITGKNRMYRSFILYALTSVFLLFAYSRASLLLFLFIGLLLVSARFWSMRKQPLSLGLLGLLSAIIGWAILTGIGQSSLEVINPFIERVTALFVGIDLSMLSRVELFRQGSLMLEQNWLIGYFLGEVVELGRGRYIHNWLSFWLAYGIGPFVLSVWIAFSLIVKTWRQRRKASLALARFSLLLFVLLAVGFARSYIWPYYWFGLGFAGTGPFSTQRGTTDEDSSLAALE